jgi:hypothetical protein
MATLPDLYNNQFAQAAAAVAVVESAYFADTGRYQQLPNLAQAGLSDPLDVTVRVDVYQGSAGHGYVVIGRASVNGVNYIRSENVGPESARTQGWAEINQGGI